MERNQSLIILNNFLAKYKKQRGHKILWKLHSFHYLHLMFWLCCVNITHESNEPIEIHFVDLILNAQSPKLLIKKIKFILVNNLSRQ